MSVDGPPLGLNVEVTAPDGSVKRWGSHGDAGDRPKGLSFNTKRGDGFADANLSLSRRIDGEYVDLGLYRDLTISGDDGTVAYEGRVTGLPRSMGDTHEVSVQSAGWMSHAQDRKFREIYVDSDMSKWTGPTTRRSANLMAANWDPSGPSQLTGGGPPELLTAITGPTSAFKKPICEAYYDGAGIPLGTLTFTWAASGNLDVSNTTYNIDAQLDDNDDQTGGRDLVALRAAGVFGGGPSDVGATTLTRRYAAVALYFNGALSLDGVANVKWTRLQVFGAHGAARRASGAGLFGFTVSDMIRDIVSRFAPMLSTAGVQDTSYVVEQAAFTEATAPYDAFTQLNAFHRWSLSVWENRTLTFAPVDLTDYDWEVRLGDPGVSIDLQGDSAQTLANGIAVNYTDAATGKAKRVDPDGYAELRDDTIENPVNLAGLKVWQELPVGFPCTQTMALQLGRAALAEFNSPKAPGTIRVRGHIRDRAGHLQQAWKVRADDRIAITNIVNDRPRLIVETGYSHDSQEVQISVDAPAQRLDAVLDRIQSGLTANGV